MTTLWDTTGTAVVKALAAERRTGGAVTSGCALTLVIVVDEADVADAEIAATTAAQQHPCRSLIVIRRHIDAPVPRLDAEVLIGGRLGPGEAVVMRMSGRLALHAESVVLPLLAPDAPVVTWWHTAPPELIANDPLGVLADRRITECSKASDPVNALFQRAHDYAPGDTDFAWTRITGWRAQLAAAFDSVRGRVVHAEVVGKPEDPRAILFAGWLRARLGGEVPIRPSNHDGIAGVTVQLDDGTTLKAHSEHGHVLVEREGTRESATAQPERSLGELLAEELRRLDPDEIYADSLGTASGLSHLNSRAPHRTHIWVDPLESTADDAGTS